jgi:hypothetical protein
MKISKYSNLRKIVEDIKQTRILSKEEIRKTIEKQSHLELISKFVSIPYLSYVAFNVSYIASLIFGFIEPPSNSRLFSEMNFAAGIALAVPTGYYFIKSAKYKSQIKLIEKTAKKIRAQEEKGLGYEKSIEPYNLDNLVREL